MKRGASRLNLTKLLMFGYTSDVPERNILIGYLVYSTVGFLLLMLPWACKSDVSWIDNLFTAVSALSTTGLATVDIPGVYTIFGQCVILALIQMGALGYMTLSTYIIYRLTHHINNTTGNIVSASVSIPYGMKLHDLVSSIIHFTVLFELLGFISFYVALLLAGTPSAG